MDWLFSRNEFLTETPAGLLLVGLVPTVVIGLILFLLRKAHILPAWLKRKEVAFDAKIKGVTDRAAVDPSYWISYIIRRLWYGTALFLVATVLATLTQSTYGWYLDAVAAENGEAAPRIILVAMTVIAGVYVLFKALVQIVSIINVASSIDEDRRWKDKSEVPKEAGSKKPDVWSLKESDFDVISDKTGVTYKPTGTIIKFFLDTLTKHVVTDSASAAVLPKEVIEKARGLYLSKLADPKRGRL